MGDCATGRCGCSGARCGSASGNLAAGTGVVTVVANNQEITAVADLGSLVTTDTYRLGDNDRATVMWNVHSIWALGGGTTTLQWYAQVSNDRVNWVDVGGAMSDAGSAPTGSTPRKKSGPVDGEFIRFVFLISNSGGTLGGASFDLHVLFDHV